MGKVEDRFWSKVNVCSPDECWEWQAGKDDKGYGEFWFPQREKHTKAHQVAWILTYGDIRDSYHVLHSCDNTSCCNPKHLFLGTNQDNVDDKMKKGRWNSRFLFGTEHPQHGENSSQHKLSESDVHEIRKLRGKMSLRAIAKRYGVSHGVISNIYQNRKWSWLK